MTIRTRLALGIFAIAVVLLVPLLLSLRSLGQVDDDVSRLRNEEIERLVLLRRASGSIEDLARIEVEAPVPASRRSPERDEERRQRLSSIEPVRLLAVADLLESNSFD